MPQHPPTSHRLWWAGRNVAVRPDGDPLSVHRRRVGLEVAELLLLLGVQPPFTTTLFWRLVKAAVLVGHTPVPSRTGWHTEPYAMRRLLPVLLLLTACGSSQLPAAECNALDDSRTKLVVRSQLAAQEAVKIQDPIRQQRQPHCLGAGLSTGQFSRCLDQAASSVPQSEILTSVSELRRLAGKESDPYVAGLMITSPAAQAKVELSKEYLKKASLVTEKMNKGSCVL